MSTPTTPLVTAADVDAAAERLRGVVLPSPVQRSGRLSEASGCEVWLKREDLQEVRSYKSRGAYNLIAQLDDDARARGVVCASAGNHAQGVAFACAALGVSAEIYLPRTTPRQKRDRVAQLGGSTTTVVVGGDAFDDASRAATERAAATGRTLIPPFDDPRTVAGQGTAIKELVEQMPSAPDYLLVPVGGGGLLAGAAVWAGERLPGTQVVGVEPAGAASMTLALERGEPTVLHELDGFVDGAAVRRVGDVNHRLVADAGVRVVAVPEGAVCVEMLELYQSDGIIAEPAGALASAALLDLDLGIPAGSTVACVLSGGNNDVSRYAEVVERALVHEGRKHYFLVQFPQEPGALRQFLDVVLGPEDDITLFEYTKRSNRETGPALVGIELGTADDLEPLLARMDLIPHQIERVPAGSPIARYLL
ncbi:threonine ammonia-lyase IlvA [Solicola sp. PLA-1-18]|uniref:threonine ammonia-lyase IlvA n=1 Tax=Solicola sp. PLA-1-18 TaxID=3380532 RepID=UPI003B773536